MGEKVKEKSTSVKEIPLIWHFDEGGGEHIDWKSPIGVPFNWDVMHEWIWFISFSFIRIEMFHHSIKVITHKQLCLVCSDRSLWGDEWTQTWWAKCPNSMTASPFVTFLISFIQVFPLICHPSVNHFIWMCIICILFALVGYIASKLSHFTFSYQ